jgi:hypothetical protein
MRISTTKARYNTDLSLKIVKNRKNSPDLGLFLNLRADVPTKMQATPQAATMTLQQQPLHK